MLDYLVAECLRNLLDLRRSIATPSRRAIALVPDARKLDQARRALWGALPAVSGPTDEPLVLRELCRHQRPWAIRPLKSYELYPFNTLLAVYRLNGAGRKSVLAALPALHEVIQGE